MAFALAMHVVILLRAADAGGLHPHRGREISGAKTHGLQPWRRCSNFFHVTDARGAFDNHLERNRLAPPLRRLNGRYQSIHRIEIACAANLGDHDLVEAV